MRTSHFFLFILGIFLFTSLKGQDTTIVQTLTFDSTSRSGTWMFPPDTGQTYRKILMQYKMRCHNAAVGNGNVGCREWDYSCNTIIRDSSQLDSAASTHPTHLIGGFSGNTFDYSFSPTYNFVEYTQQQVVYNSTISENTYGIGAGAFFAHAPFETSIPDAKSQFLWTASELTSAGMATGPITGMRLDLNSLGPDVRFLRIRMRHSSATVLDEIVPDDASWVQVYFLDTQFPSTGPQTFPFYQNFVWNGTDNVVVEFSYSLNNAGNVYQVQHDIQPSTMSVISKDWDGYGAFDGNDDKIVWTPSSQQSFPAFTVEFWTRVSDPNQGQYSGFFNTGSTNRDFQIDMDGNGNIRLLGDSRSGDFGPATGDWQHVALVLNGTTLRTYLYLDGVAVDSVAGAPDNVVQDFTVGENRGGNNRVEADIDEVRIWDVVRSPAEIQSNMYKRMAGNEPGLYMLWRMDDAQGSPAMDGTGGGRNGTKSGNLATNRYDGIDIFKGLQPATDRPKVTFIRGMYNMTVTPILVTDSIQNPANPITYFGVSGTNLDTLAAFDGWQSGWQYTYDDQGNLIDSSFANADSTLNIGTLNYFRKNPMDLEIMSFVTPYGNGLDLGPDGEMWEFDVTDFSPVLHGPVYMYMNRGGQFQEEMDIRFLMIEGTPPRDVKSIRNIWPIPGILGQPGNNYANYAADLIQEPRDVVLGTDEDAWKIRTMVTGHGQEGEFISRVHYMNVDGGPWEWSWPVWKECSEVPVYPQGGTWLFDRAGWCPGDPTDLQEFPLDGLANPGDTINLDYGISTISNPGDTRYLTSHLLVGYGNPNHTLDAAVVRVKRPSDRTEFSRYNPACTQPVVIIRNEGSDPLTSLTITYNVRGGSPSTFSWTGNLDFLESEEVELPISNPSFWTGGTADVFEVALSQPNGAADQNSFNDTYASEFEPWATYLGGLEINWRTNNNGSQTTWKVYDDQGNVAAENTPFLGNNIVYNEDLNIPAGCYRLRFDDSADDGLYYWFFPQNGSGYARISEYGVTQVSFENEFGGFFEHDFWTDGLVNGEEVTGGELLSIWPNPSEGIFHVRMDGFAGREVAMQVYDLMGRIVWEAPPATIGSGGFMEEVVDVSNLVAGRYFLRVWDGQRMRTKSIEIHR